LIYMFLLCLTCTSSDCRLSTFSHEVGLSSTARTAG
jgi:hypothetical protein